MTSSSSSVRYSQLAFEDGRDQRESAFDYSSHFTYENEDDANWKYRSAFTYDNKSLIIETNNGSESPLAGNSWARIFVLFGFLVVYTFAFPILIWFSFKRIKDNERFVVFRLGKSQGTKGPGLRFVLPILDRCHKINVHLKAFSVPPKQVITSDGAIIEVGAEIYHQVTDAERSVKNVQDLNHSTRILVQSSLCNILSDKTLAEIEAERKIIQDVLMEKSNKTCSSWGLEIQRAELSQIKVLSDPPPKSNPTLMMPPGLMEMSIATAAGGLPEGMPSAFMHLASAVVSASKGDKTDGQSIADALEAFKGFQVEKSEGTQQPSSSSTTELEEQINLAAEACGDSVNNVKPPCSSMSADQLVALISGCLDESLVQKVEATYQFDIQGENGGLFYLDLSHGCGSIARGNLPSGEANVGIVTSAEDLQTMLSGNLSPFNAYMSGQLQISGDVKIALKLDELANRLKPHLNANG